MQTVKPERGFVFAELPQPEKENKTESGILLTSKKKDDVNCTAKAINIGDGTEVSFKPGDTIIYRSYGGTEIKLNGDLYILLNVKDIVGSIQEVADV